LTNLLRRHAWVLSPSEVLSTALLLFLLILSLGAWFSGQIGALPVLGYAVLDLAAWALWLGWVLHRRPAPMGGWGVLRAIAPFLSILFAWDLTGRLSNLIHPEVYDFSMRPLGPWFFKAAVPPSWAAMLGGSRVLAILHLSLAAWALGLTLFHLLLRRSLLQRLIAGSILLFGVVCVGHLLFPVLPPRVADPAPWEGFSGRLFHLADLACCRLRPFPGLHGVLAAFLLAWQWRQDRRGLAWGVPLATGAVAAAYLMGDLYPADLASGVLAGGIAAGVAPLLERAIDRYRLSLDPPVTWLEDVVEGHGDAFGKLVGRLGALLPLGGASAPGVVYGCVPRHRGEGPLRQAVERLGEGPYWLRPSDESGSKRNTLLALKPLSREQALRTVFLASGRKNFLLQKALKVTAVGLCRSHPSRGGALAEAVLRVTLLPRGETRELRLWPGALLGGRVEGPWVWFPKDFPVRGFELRELVTLTRRLADRWGSTVEVEWVLSEGRIRVLDGRAARQDAN
jgi:hypothetical protein